MMEMLRMTTIGDSRGQKNRRNTTSGMGNLFKTAIGTAFANFLSEAVCEKPTLQQNEQMIKQTIKRINQIVDEVDTHITKRLQVHEQELFGIVRQQVQQMKKETERVIQTLNEKITEKDVNSQLWKLNNELDYFKNQSFKLFQDNRKLRVQIKVLKKSVRDYQNQQECLDALLQKFRKREMRGRSKGDKKIRIKNKFKEGNNISKRYEKGSIAEQIQPLQNQQEQKIKQQDEESIIRINILGDNVQEQKQIKFQFNSKEQGESISLPSLNIPSQKQKQSSEHRPVHLKQVQSESIYSQKTQQKYIAQKQSKYTQTDPVKVISQFKKNTFTFNKQKNLLAIRTQHRQRCRTQRNMNLTRKSQANIQEKQITKVTDWIGSCGTGQKYAYKVSNYMKKSKKQVNHSALYVSSVIGRNKLQPTSVMAETGYPIRTGRL